MKPMAMMSGVEEGIRSIGAAHLAGVAEPRVEMAGWWKGVHGFREHEPHKPRPNPKRSGHKAKKALERADRIMEKFGKKDRSI